MALASYIVLVSASTMYIVGVADSKTTFTVGLVLQSSYRDGRTRVRTQRLASQWDLFCKLHRVDGHSRAMARISVRKISLLK